MKPLKLKVSLRSLDIKKSLQALQLKKQGKAEQGAENEKSAAAAKKEQEKQEIKKAAKSKKAYKENQRDPYPETQFKKEGRKTCKTHQDCIFIRGSRQPESRHGQRFL